MKVYKIIFDDVLQEQRLRLLNPGLMTFWPHSGFVVCFCTYIYICNFLGVAAAYIYSQPGYIFVSREKTFV